MFPLLPPPAPPPPRSAIILCSITALVVQTSWPFRVHNVLLYPEQWYVWEAFSSITFTLEYGLRWCTCDDKLDFTFQPLNMVDILTFAPFYVEALLPPGSVDVTLLRVFRLLRLARIVKLAKHNEDMQLFGRVIGNSAMAIQVLIIFITVAVIIFGSLIYYAERGQFDSGADGWVRGDGTLSPFKSIPHSFWWCIVTMTTVGYGDMYPITPAGKIVGTVAMLVRARLRATGQLLCAATPSVPSAFKPLLQLHAMTTASSLIHSLHACTTDGHLNFGYADRHHRLKLCCRVRDFRGQEE